MKKILLADDEPNLRLLVRLTLESDGSGDYEILETADGSATLELARREHPDVLILDWMMPGMTGIEVVRSLRSDPHTSDIPVLMLSAKGQQADRAEGLGAGASMYLTKPFSPAELLETVDELAARTGHLQEVEPPSVLVERPYLSSTDPSPLAPCAS